MTQPQPILQVWYSPAGACWRVEDGAAMHTPALVNDIIALLRERGAAAEFPYTLNTMETGLVQALKAAGITVLYPISQR